MSTPLDNLRELAGRHPGGVGQLLVNDARWLVEHLDALEALRDIGRERCAAPVLASTREPLRLVAVELTKEET